jgi:hypothetical protein
VQVQFRDHVGPRAAITEQELANSAVAAPRAGRSSAPEHMLALPSVARSVGEHFTSSKRDRAK